MSRLEQAIKTIVEVFMENADGDGKLNKEEFQKLLDKEIESAEIKAKISAVGCDKIMGRVDKNHDGELNFGEFSKCVCFLANCCYHKMSGKGEECGHKCK